MTNDTNEVKPIPTIVSASDDDYSANATYHDAAAGYDYSDDEFDGDDLPVEDHDTTQLMTINAADLLRFRWVQRKFRWTLMHPNQPEPFPGDTLPLREVQLAVDIIKNTDDIDRGLRVRIVPDNIVMTDSLGDVMVPRSLMLIYKATLYNLHVEGDKIAQWESWYKTFAWVFGFIAITEAAFIFFR